MITVKDTFNFTEMKNGVVRAGKVGLGRRIRWVHIIDHEDIGDFLEGGEFLLSSGQIWSKDLESAEQLLQTFLEKQIAGIVFATGHYLMEVPQEALTFGNKHSIPIIEVPFHVSFVKVTRSIHEAILSESHHSPQSSEYIPIELIDKVTTAASMTEICDRLSIHLNSYVFITDHQHRVLTKSIPVGVRHIKSSTIIDKLRETLELVSSSKSEDRTSLFELDKVTFVPAKKPPYVLFIPLQINEKSPFIFWIFDPYRPLGQEERKVAEYVAVLLKDSILNEKKAITELTERRLEFLELLFEESMDHLPKINNKARELGLYPVSNWLIGHLLLPDDWTIKDSLTIRDYCQKWLDKTPEILGICEKYEHELIIFVSLHSNFSDYKRLFHNLYLHLQTVTSNNELILLMSNLQQELSSFSDAYEEIRALLPIVQSKRNSDSIYFAEQLQRELLLYGNLEPERARAIQKLILPIELLSEKEKFLYETLKYLVEYGFNREQVARAMYIHRNTLRYRMKRLEELLNEDLSSAESQFWIRVALDLETIATNA